MTTTPRHVLGANGVETSYETHGDGDVVVLLHGGMVAGDSWSNQVPALASRRRVIVPDRRGHGYTADVDGPYSYDLMATDTIAFIERVATGPADLVGWSDGGIVGLLVAMARPQLVRKLVVIGTYFHLDGVHPAFAPMLSPDPAAPELAAVAAAHAESSPDGADHWPVFINKLVDLYQREPRLSVEDIRRITCPVLVVVGDDDCVRHEHTLELFDALPKGQLAIVPGTSHVLPFEKPALLNELIIDFLDDGEPRRFLPIRSATTT